ncbi:MAG: redoxin domain-containing protein [Bacteroidales bacterium]|nr:redoxin domain-containing protein [Bacteroidales bacterium]
MNNKDWGLKVFSFLFFLFIAIVSNAQNLRIELKGENIGGKTIKLISIMDNLSNLETEIASKQLNQTDTLVNFSVLIENTSFMKIRIETFDYGFIAQKGASYNMRLLPFDFNIKDSINTLFYKFELPIIIENTTDNNLNRTIYSIDTTIENYLIDNKKEILFYRDKKKVDSLKLMVYSLIDSAQSNYINDYVKYSLGKIEFSSKTINDKKLKAQLFYDKPILYDNIGYMDCFEVVYGHYFTEGNKVITKQNLIRWFENNNYFSLIDSLGVDTLLKNEVFRELVFLRGMKEAYFSTQYNSLNIVSMLENFIYQTKFKEHVKIAKNLLELFSQKSYYGSNAKEFSLQDIHNNYITLDKFKGKPLILSFVKLHEPSCLRELNMMYSFVDTLKDNFNFLTIACDNSLDALFNFLVNSNVGVRYKWDFAHFGGNWDLLKAYNVAVFPTFILIDSKGTIIQNPMRKPSEGSLIPFVPRKEVVKEKFFLDPK